MPAIVNTRVQVGPDRHAVLVRVPAVADPREVAEALGLARGTPTLIVCGAPGDGPPPDGAGDAIAAAAGRTGAVVLDGGADAGLSAVLGAARGEDPRLAGPLVGVGPAPLVRLGPAPGDDGGPAAHPHALGVEPHHTHLVLADTDRWGGEARLVVGLALALADGFPVAALLAGGDDAALVTAREAVGRGVPLLVLDGDAAGRVAARAGERVTLVEDPAQLTHALTWALHADAVLKDAWSLFATCDAAAKRLRRRFERIQASILALGVLAALLALLHEAIGTQALRWAVIVASLLVGGLVALTGRRATGKRWIATRAAAECVKSQIFRYRTGTGRYAADPEQRPAGSRTRPPDRLASELEGIQMRLMHSEAGSAALDPYEGPLPPDGDATGDDGLGALDPERYLQLRVADQIAYYQRRLHGYERWRTALQALAVAAGAAGAIVAAAGAETWVALTSALGAAPLAYLAHLQVDHTIVVYNQSAARLEGLTRRWHSHPPPARTPATFAALVDATEAVLTSEHGAWVEQMTEALRELDASEDRHEASGH